VQSFAKYLVEIGVLPSNALRDVKAPRANPPRCRFLELPDVLRVVEGSEEPYRAIFAVAYGAGLEVSAILALVESDVDHQRREIRARGEKFWTRDRIARVADWAWPIVEAHWRSVLPGERLFRGVDRWEAGDFHRERLRALGVPHHTLHDSRHHWAVRMVRAGMPLELVARQLGHKDVVMVAYGAPASAGSPGWGCAGVWPIRAEQSGARPLGASRRRWTQKNGVGKVHWVVHRMTNHLNRAAQVVATMIAGEGLEPSTPAL